MRILIHKELISILCSGVGLFFALVFLPINGLMLWLFEGNFNILDAGYADLSKFFSLSSILLMLLTPALTMRLIAEEKRSRTWDMLRSRPVSVFHILLSKWISTLIFIVLVISPTLIYVYSISYLSSSVAVLDTGVVLVSYLSLIGLSGVFIAIGLFASSLSSNQLISFAVSLFINGILYFGFDLAASLFEGGSTRIFVVSCGLFYHLTEIQRGVVTLNNIWVFINYTWVFFVITIYILSIKKHRLKKQLLVWCISLLVLNSIVVLLPHLRFDFTADKRYTLSNYSRELVSSLARTDAPQVKIRVYLDGNLNFGFQRLQNAAGRFLADLNRYADYKIDVSFIDPSSINLSQEDLPPYMAKQNMPPVVLNEVDRSGKLSQQLIYPYSQVIVNNDTLVVAMLKNIKGNTAEENLSASVVDLEFEFVDALRLLLRQESQAIAFIEGHGELPRPYLHDAEEALAKYFFVNRGQIGNDPLVLDDFRVVIIAGPTQQYSETEKYILDQYLMKGGRILWLVDGAYVSLSDLKTKAQSASTKNETALDDLLFTYGVRIDPDLLQDAQSSQILVQNSSQVQPVAIPWYYSPLLLPLPNHSITKNIAEVKATFVSGIRILNNTRSVTKSVLLTTSQHSRIIPVPEMVTLDVETIQSDPNYFNESFIPTAVSLQGTFGSAFANRLVPDSVDMKTYKNRNESRETKMIVVSSSDIIKNEIAGQGEKSEALPMGYDRISGRKYGNKDFIVNAVNWLANDDGWMELRSKTQYLNLLDKKRVNEHRTRFVMLNIAFPICLVLFILGSATLWRRYRYTR